MCEKLLDEILEYAAVSRSLEHAGNKDIVNLRISDFVGNLAHTAAAFALVKGVPCGR